VILHCFQNSEPFSTKIACKLFHVAMSGNVMQFKNVLMRESFIAYFTNKSLLLVRHMNCGDVWSQMLCVLKPRTAVVTLERTIGFSVKIFEVSVEFLSRNKTKSTYRTNKIAIMHLCVGPWILRLNPADKAHFLYVTDDKIVYSGHVFSCCGFCHVLFVAVEALIPVRHGLRLTIFTIFFDVDLTFLLVKFHCVDRCEFFAAGWAV
jgi:hypothetical protein